MTTKSERVMDEYLGRLERSLRDVPTARREEIISGIVDHIDEALAEEPDDNEASVRNVLDRVGDPEEIASEARERLDIRQSKPSWTDAAAIVLLLIGGFLFLVGWVAGVVLLWISDVWSARQKIIGTLLVPGGLATPFLLLLTPVEVTTCSISTVDGVRTSVCEGASDGATVLAWVVLVLLIVAPIAVSVYLGRTLMRARRR
jgi:uncharacterized membrane protein